MVLKISQKSCLTKTEISTVIAGMIPVGSMVMNDRKDYPTLADKFAPYTEDIYPDIICVVR